MSRPTAPFLTRRMTNMQMTNCRPATWLSGAQATAPGSERHAHRSHVVAHCLSKLASKVGLFLKLQALASSDGYG